MRWYQRLFRRARTEKQLDKELRFHLEQQIADYVAAGIAPDEARRRAGLDFGGLDQVKEECRDIGAARFVETLIQDLRYGLRQLRRNPGFTAVATIILALGIGGNAAIFSFIDALILRMLPVQHPQALVLFGPGDGSGNSDYFPNDDMNLFSFSIYREMQKENGVFSGVASFGSFENGIHGNVGPSGNLEPMEVEAVSGTYFNVLGVKPMLGRVFTDVDDRMLGGHPIAVISYGWWNNRFSRDPSILGKRITIGSTVYTIVGVAPPGFFGTVVGRSPDLWVPLQMEDLISRGPHKLNDKFYRFLDIMARLRPGVARTQAAANVNLILKNILHEYAGARPSRAELEDIRRAHITLNPAATGMSFLRQSFSEPLWILMAMVGLVLVIACANVANLLLARGTARQREIAVRMAVGAGRSRLIRQLLTESLLLGGVGGALGVLFAEWACRFLLSVVSHTQNVLALDVSPDARVFAFTLVVSVGCSVLFGILPALRSTRVALTPALKEGRGTALAHDRSPLGKALIISQVALSLVLLVGAGLFIRSLMNLANVNMGFNGRGVLVLSVDPSATGYSDEPRLDAMYREVEQRVDALPGVTASSFSIFNFGPGSWNDSVWAEGYPDASERSASYNAIGSGYFAAMGIPLLAGRDIGPNDTASSPRVAVINETMARDFFPGESPVGKRFGTTDRAHDHDIQVIGVVRDAKYTELDEKPTPMAYFPYTQYRPDWGIGLYLDQLAVRSSGNPQAVLPDIRRVVSEVNKNLPIDRVTTLTDKVEDSITFQRLMAELAGFFGALALFLACIGVYGLTSYAVARRTNEIGIRMALGAQRVDVIRTIVQEMAVLMLTGLAIGIPAALGSGRLAASVLYGLRPDDPVTLLSAAALLFAVGVLAGLLPARRAAKLDPMVALRHE
jgi:predicted permease